MEVHRAQGELDVLERILGLETELKEFAQRKLTADIRDNERQRERIGDSNVG